MRRRGVLAGLLAAVAQAAVAQEITPTGTLRPVPRPDPAATVSVAPPNDMRPRARPSVQDIIRAADLGGTVGFVALDLETGRDIDSGNAPIPLPPASVTKVFTSLYALETLGADHRFVTRFLATGPIVAGQVQGDLILAGGGDPTLLTDHLAELVTQLAATGLRGVSGRFLVWHKALPPSDSIDPGQAAHLGYNPAVGGLNLNFNRVYFEWARDSTAQGGYAVTMDARSDTYRPALQMARMQVVDRASPLYTYQDEGGVDYWTVAKSALGDRGGRWLPVRDPARYAGEVAQVFGKSHGITLPDPVVADTLPEAVELARWTSVPLTEICRDLLHFSTNLTAEVIGLAATAKRLGRAVPQRASAREMALWVLDRTGVAARFVDHSGLHDETHVSARAMVRLLTATSAQALLQPILKTIPMTDAQGKEIRGHAVDVRAKTGTLNFVSTLAGYATGPGGGSLAFAIFAANDLRRAETAGSSEDWPPGAESWNLRARRMQQELLQRWGARV